MLRFDETTVAVDNASDDRTSSPQHKLMLVEGALMTLRIGLRSRSPELRRRCCEVERWICSPDSKSPFSLESVCTTLGLDPAYIRFVLKQLKRHAVGEEVRRDCGTTSRQQHRPSRPAASKVVQIAGRRARARSGID